MENPDLNPEDPHRIRVLNADYQPAGFWIRLAASFLDSIFFYGLWTFVLLIFGLASGASPAKFLTQIGAPAMLVGSLLTYSVYVAVAWNLFSTTLAKKMLGLTPIDVRTKKDISVVRGLLREVPCKWLSSIPFQLGFVMVALRQDKRGLHDLLAKTQVVRRVSPKSDLA